MSDPLVRAEIEVISPEYPIEVDGFSGGASVPLPAGRGVRLPADAALTPDVAIFTPGPLKPVIRALRAVEGDVEPLADEVVASLGAHEPIVYAISNTDRVDLRRFRLAAAQAADLGRRLVIVAQSERDG